MKTASPGNTTYYLDSAKGDDKNPGTSATKAWKTLARANQTVFAAGDKLLLAAGQTFAGTLALEKEVQGAQDLPITIASFGQGRATIDGGKGTGIRLAGCAFVRIQNLNIIGCGRKAGNDGNGIEIALTRGVTIDGVDVSGFRLAGIAAGGDADTRIANARAHDNGFAGISVCGGYGKPRTTNLYIGHCVAHDNPGDPKNLTNHSGNGIVVGQLDGGLVEFCAAYNNGWDMPRQGNG
ncbi:MAG: right-handed parallel beta-helix repeat-containing protein, partial [Planctomycetota bacterium]|nr:right-handed parallel beta-helix repeat-containing protein [Planctomycetota bacterium]